jgi:hypothetical protein
MDLDVLKVNLVSLSAIGISLAEVNEMLRTVALLSAIVYTIVKIVQRVKK